MAFFAVDEKTAHFYISIGAMVFGFLFLIGMLILRDRFLQKKIPAPHSQPMLRIGNRKDWREGLQRFGLIMAAILGAPVAIGVLPKSIPPIFKAALGSAGFTAIWYLAILFILPDKNDSE